MDIDEEIAKTDDRVLHVWAEPDAVDYQRRGRAKCELERRSREWEEEQSEARRDFEREIFNAESERDTKHKAFEKQLADKQMAHATALAAEQDKTANRVAWATIFAAIAAAFSAAGALVDVVKFFSDR